MKGIQISDLPWLAYLAIQIVLRLVGLAVLIVGIPHWIQIFTESDLIGFAYFVAVIVLLYLCFFLRRKK